MCYALYPLFFPITRLYVATMKDRIFLQRNLVYNVNLFIFAWAK